MNYVKIIDLDGCISDDRWRRQLIADSEGRSSASWATRFDMYHSAAEHDTSVNLHELADQTCEYVVFTGRPVRYAEATRRWLRERAGLLPRAILHRNNDDHRPSHEVKSTQMEWLTAANCNYGVRYEDIVEAIDDIEAVVKMYQARWQLKARVVRIGDGEHENG